MTDQRTLAAIAAEIRTVWPNPYFGAVPYIRAMSEMRSAFQPYGADSGASVVRYFLSNARTWRGDHARRIKRELQGMLPRQ